MAQSSLVAVIILNFNGLEDTRRAVRCVRAIDRFAVRPMVIDNGSENDEASYLRLEFPDIDIERFDRNVGFSRAVNHAARRAIRNGATHLLLMNSDAWVGDGNRVFSHLLRVFKTDEKIAAVGPAILDVDGTTLQSAGYHFSLWWPVPRANRSLDKVSQCFFASGSFLMLDAELFCRVGGFDPDFFLYGEDLDFAARCKAAGYRIVVSPDVAVCHRRGASSRIMSNRYIYTALRGNLINISKHARWYQLPSCVLASVAISCGLIGFAARAGNFTGVTAVFRAWRDFFRRRWGGLQAGYVLTDTDRPNEADYRRAA